MAGEGRKNKERGTRFEREVIARLQDPFGIAAERCPLSGTGRGSFNYDISVPILGRDWLWECKVRKPTTGFPLSLIYECLATPGINGVFAKLDRMPPLVVTDLDTFASLVRDAERYRADPGNGIFARDERDTPWFWVGRP